jgi:hypothetical protein
LYIFVEVGIDVLVVSLVLFIGFHVLLVVGISGGSVLIVTIGFVA